MVVLFVKIAYTVNTNFKQSFKNEKISTTFVA